MPKSDSSPTHWRDSRPSLLKRIVNLWTISFVAVLGVLAAAFFLYALPKRQSAEHLQEGIACFKVGNYPCALSHYDRAFALDPQNLATRLHRGVARIKAEQYKQGIEDLNTVLQLAPSNRQLYSVLADAYLALGDYEQALRYSSQAIEYQPGGELYLKRGTIQLELTQYQEALEDLRQAEELTPDNLLIYIKRGSIYQIIGSSDEAIAEYSKVVAHEDSVALFRASAVDDSPFSADDIFRAGPNPYDDFSDFSPDYAPNRQAGSVDPARQQLSDAYYRRGFLLHKKQQLSKAERDYSAALKLVPDQAEVLYARGIVRQELGQYAQGRADIRNALQIDPTLKAQ